MSSTVNRCVCLYLQCKRPFAVNNNESAQSNLGRGPRRCAFAHIRRKVPIGYNGVPKIRPQKYPFPWPDP